MLIEPRDFIFGYPGHGGIEISAIVNDHRVSMVYMGYTKKEAVKLFKEYVKEQII